MASQSERRVHGIHNLDIMDVKVPRYHVVMYNDDYTTFEFVFATLVTVFQKTEAEAKALTMHIHQKGSGIAGTYCHEVAEMKVSAVRGMAEKAGYPLRVELEPEK